MTDEELRWNKEKYQYLCCCFLFHYIKFVSWHGRINIIHQHTLTGPIARNQLLTFFWNNQQICIMYLKLNDLKIKKINVKKQNLQLFT